MIKEWFKQLQEQGYLEQIGAIIGNKFDLEQNVEIDMGRVGKTRE
ncbi:unnamed protein product [Paramecium sonneborni]|uniref:Uncharacterized protein n=1 Tax=Paramecium sonneborni TaxID=65129 RepID=A0A8S1LK81_9CILI|nr:unnamed protein product [Paramecium sonneborni]